ncbi:MAG TPA: cytochrome c [Thermoanaerobaculia bacterium]|jgi:mono/diheme cytochrome c family protein|nr:cytochrome c [Thermoanaerobaculia bacterium]
MTTPTLSEMFYRLWKAAGQSRSARSVEVFGWVDLALGTIILFAPYWVESVLHLPPLTVQGANYLRVVGLLVSGLGMLYVVSGRLNAQGFVFASLLDRPLVPFVMAFLWSQDIVPGPLALAFSVTDFGGFLWTLLAWRAEVRRGQDVERPRLGKRLIAGFFGFVSGVVRNSRTFHPDGRVFLGTVRSLQPADASLARAAEQLEGAVLLRMGMGLMKRGWPRWLADLVPDAPSIAARFYTASTPGEVRLERRPGEDLDLLCTAGGDRLWKLVVNLATGGKMYGLRQFDYFQNEYYAQVPCRIDDGRLDVWIRFVPDLAASHLESGSPEDGAERDEDLTRAVAGHAVVRIEVQRTGDADEPFVPIAEFRFEEEIQIDQEALHFDPIAGRGFVPHGVLTDVRRSVYPASVQSRPASGEERVRRETESIARRLARFLHQPPSPVLAEGSPVMNTPAAPAVPAHRKRRWLKIALLAILAVVVLFGVYLTVRFTSDSPDVYPRGYDSARGYDGEVEHFKYGSLGGERTLGIPYWIWVALPELFPEHLPDKTRGRGYSSFGMIYEEGKDPRYDLPIGVSRRNVQGIDRVFLNCAACHTGTVRKAPGAQPQVVVGMPANTFDTGAWANFLSEIARDEKFTPERLLAQIRLMENKANPGRLVKVNKLDLINRLLLRFYAIYVMREQMLGLGPRAEGLIDFKIWGPGRNDTFGADKVFFRFPPNDPNDPQDLRESNGMADFPSVWYQGPRQKAKMGLHWDGNNDDVAERNLNAAYAAGVIPPAGDFESMQRTAKWLETAKPPLSFRDLFPINDALAAQGKPVYQHYCAGCHGTREPPFTGERVGKVTPITAIGTDPHRLDSYTWQLSVNLATNYAGYEKHWGFDKDYPHRFLRYRKTQGYANTPLDGLWLRAPYLHNGSVLNLRELLDPAASPRTPVFCRGNDVYDPVNVGFVSNFDPSLDEKDQCGRFFRFDTTVPGNGNGGHEGPKYGTDLPAEQKQALLEYLKTF